jgi:uncharacterized protein YukE
MALPKQVQAQLAEVEELEKTLTAQSEPKKKKAEEPEISEEELDTEAEVTDEAEAAPEPEEAKPADTSPTDVEDDFKQKYNTLRGKYDAEVPRLHQQVRELTTKLDALSKQLTEKPAEPTKAKEKVSYVTDEDRAEFGEELIDVQRRVAKEVAQEYEDRFEQQEAIINELQKQLKQTGSQVGEMNFSQKLVQLVPDFQQIDNDERWIAWLEEYDPILRDKRRVPAEAAFRAGDAEAVAHYVKLFKESIADPAPEEQVKAKRKTELEKQVAPNRSANSSKTQTSNAKLYSEREIQAGWDKIRMLNKRGDYSGAEKLEAELTSAYLEGRVR